MADCRWQCAPYSRYCLSSSFLLLKVLTLRKEEVIRHDKTLCGERISVRPYHELGSVETGLCCCFVCVDSNLGTIIPSFGCDRDAVNCIVQELNERVASRGDAAQVLTSLKVAARTNEINEKMELIAQHLMEVKNVQGSTPPPTAFTIEDR